MCCRVRRAAGTSPTRTFSLLAARLQKVLEAQAGEQPPAAVHFQDEPQPGHAAARLPDPPTGRNRFAPAPQGPARRAHTADASGAADAIASSASPSGQRPASSGPPAPSARGQGAYLPFPDGSFAGSAPFRSAPTQESGVLFERYGRRERAHELPEVQVRCALGAGAPAVEQARVCSLRRPPSLNCAVWLRRFRGAPVGLAWRCPAVALPSAPRSHGAYRSSACGELGAHADPGPRWCPVRADRRAWHVN
jgi:hypothetical protein